MVVWLTPKDEPSDRCARQEIRFLARRRIFYNLRCLGVTIITAAPRSFLTPSSAFPTRRFFSAVASSIRI